MEVISHTFLLLHEKFCKEDVIGWTGGYLPYYLYFYFMVYSLYMVYRRHTVSCTVIARFFFFCKPHFMFLISLLDYRPKVSWYSGKWKKIQLSVYLMYDFISCQYYRYIYWKIKKTLLLFFIFCNQLIRCLFFECFNFVQTLGFFFAFIHCRINDKYLEMYRHGDCLITTSHIMVGCDLL